ncbi:hypothetical protein [Bacillus sp. FJAT-49736]|uniref:hypothetical protein n=1 Tax=Bacillus sp. FJAT-49736 TaxID=2833582 RepID=UPI001BCA2888|nr:hypothetical protein [Bacillus sp. FJAT-49736]MBS4173480.1 hypothetical protein [Bacillus sp. FJAT-49736]
MQKHDSWTEEEHNKLIELKGKGLSYQQIADELTRTYCTLFTFDGVRNRYRYFKDKEPQETPPYKETTEILHDGTHKSDKLLRMSSEQSKDVNYLLKAHGFDVDEWELVSARNNIWNAYSKQDGVQTLYSSKITVKPKTNEFNFDRFIEIIQKTKPARPITFKGILKQEKTYLHIPLFDMHFGNSRLEHYKDTLREIVHLLEETYHEVLFIVGQDLLHNDNFKGQTANGTPIDKVNMIKAWEEADTFYTTLISKALEKSPKVTVIYSKGNHDESMSWGFVKMLEAKFGHQVNFDTSFRERKAYMLGLNFIGTTHGDKNRTNIASNFSVEFPEMWARATTREVYMGHLHRKRVTKPIEVVNDSRGVIVRELGTGNEIDGYHDDHGYTLAHQEFEIFEYTERKKKRIHYV